MSQLKVQLYLRTRRMTYMTGLRSLNMPFGQLEMPDTDGQFSDGQFTGKQKPVTEAWMGGIV